jgi:uncharacterized membrane protein YbhN (UPF0104 family)
MRRSFMWVLQGALAVAVAVFVWRSFARHWAEFRALEIDLVFNVGLIALAALTVWITYALLIEAWRGLVIGWQQPIGRRAAARVWLVSNLGRYLPGKFWSVAGLAVLASRAGVSGWAATGSALAMQALALGTGAVVVAFAAPQSASPIQLAAAVGVAAVCVWVLVSPTLGARLLKAVRPEAEFRPLAARVALSAALVMLVAWVAYGAALWLLARGLLPGSALTLRGAVGVFAAGYIVGLLALFAPGGVGVRELVLVALLTPRVGPGGAVALAVASRLLLTVCEVGGALAAVALASRSQEHEE